MNKIYKVVWSKVKNCYVVVSELAKNVITGSVKSAKIGSTPMAKGLALGAVMAFVITGNVWAADYTERIGTNVKESYSGDTFKEVKTTGKLGIWQGGVLSVEGSKTVSFTDCVFEGNEFSPERVNANDHGKVHGGVIYNVGTVTIDGCEFTDNKIIAPSDAYGAAISNNGGNMTITDSEFSGNTTKRVGTDSDSRGSAIHNSGTIRIEDSVIANSSGGRAVYNSAGTATLSGNTFSNNARGAVQTEDGASVIFEDENTFQDNGGNSIKNKGVATFKEGSVTTFTNNGVDIDNFGVVNVQKNSTVTMGSGMTGAGTVNVGGTLDGRIYVNEEDAARGANEVALSGGIWNVKGESEVASITGNGYNVTGDGESTLTVVNDKNDSTTNSNGVYSVGSATISDLKELNVTSNRHALEVATDMKISDVGTVNLTSNNSNGIMVYGDLDINNVDVLNIEAQNSHGIRASKDDNHSASVNINVKELNITAQKDGETALKGSDGASLNVVATEKADIKGDIEAKGGAMVGLELNGAESSLTGAVKTEEGAKTTLTMNDGATWYVDGDSDLSVLAGSGANIKVGNDVSKINVGDNQNDDVNVSKDANGSVATDQALVNLKNVLQGDVDDMNIDATLTNAAITGDVTLDASGKKITTLYTKLNVTDGLKVNTSGEGSFSIGNIGGNTLFYGMSTDAGKSNPTIVMNAQNGNIETQGSLSVGNGAFVSDVASGNASVAGSLEVGGDAGIAGGLNVGTDVVAEGDVYAGDVSLKETAAKVENNEKAIGENRNDIEANREAIEDVQDVANKNAGDIAVNKEAIKELQDATNKNTADIAVNKEAIEANKQAIADEAAAREAADKALSDAIDNVVGDIADTKAQVEDNKAAIEQNAQDLANEVADRVAADNKLQQKLDKESVDRQIADAQERAERAQADQELQANIDKEVQERQAADAREAQIRSNEDQRIESKFDGEVNRLDNRIDKVEDRVDKVGAMAAAMASLRTMGYDPEAPTEIAVGIGQYRSETGLAIGAFHYPNKDFMLNFSLSTAGDEVMGGVGATWKIGRKKPAGETVEDKVAKAEAMKEAAKAARVKAQQVKHSEMLANKSK